MIPVEKPSSRPDPATVPDHAPVRVRHAFGRELINSATMPVAIGLLEGQFMGVLASKVFAADPFIYTTVIAAPNFSNLSSLFWNRLAEGRPKVRLITFMQAALLVCLLAIALCPVDRLGQWILMFSVITARCLLVGIVTLRSAIWRHNYPRRVRATLTGRLAMFNSLIMASTCLLAAWFLKENPQAFRIIYFIGIGAAIIAAIAFSGVRVRGEKAILAREIRARADHRITPSLGMWTILRQDPLFRAYMICQMLAGASNMMVEPVINSLVTNTFNASFTVSVLIVTVLPITMITLTIPIWARRLDRQHVALFRISQGVLWTVSQLVTWLGAMVGSLVVIGIGRVLLGIAHGGGVLAWNLGHNDFATDDKATAYMTAHVTLTGMRGLIAGYLGMSLFLGTLIMPGSTRLVELPFTLGHHIFLLAAVLSFTSILGYRKLYSQLKIA